MQPVGLSLSLFLAFWLSGSTRDPVCFAIIMAVFAESSLKVKRHGFVFRCCVSVQQWENVQCSIGYKFHCWFLVINQCYFHFNAHWTPFPFPMSKTKNSFYNSRTSCFPLYYLQCRKVNRNWKKKFIKLSHNAQMNHQQRSNYYCKRIIIRWSIWNDLSVFIRLTKWNQSDSYWTNFERW